MWVSLNSLLNTKNYTIYKTYISLFNRINNEYKHFKRIQIMNHRQVIFCVHLVRTLSAITSHPLGPGVKNISFDRTFFAYCYYLTK